MIELCIPSTVDPTLAPEGHHVLSFFTQYTPYHLSNGREWDEETKKAYADIGTREWFYSLPGPLPFVISSAHNCLTGYSVGR